MNVKIILILMFLCSFLASQSDIKPIGIAKMDTLPVATYIEKDAEYIVAELLIQNDDKNPLRRYETLEKTVDDLKIDAKLKEYITLQFLPDKPISKKGKLWSITHKSTLNFRVLVSLKQFNNDFLAAAKALTEFVDDLSPHQSTNYILSPLKLAISQPEYYREEILKKIAADLSLLQNIFGKQTGFSIYGLENPVSVVHLNGKKIALFINYKIKLKNYEFN